MNIHGSSRYHWFMSIPILSVYKFRGRNRSLSWLKSSSESCASVAHSLDVLREILEVPWLEWLEAIILILVDAQVVYIIELAAMEQVMEHVKEQKSEQSHVLQPWWLWVWAWAPSFSCH